MIRSTFFLSILELIFSADLAIAEPVAREISAVYGEPSNDGTCIEENETILLTGNLIVSSEYSTLLGVGAKDITDIFVEILEVRQEGDMLVFSMVGGEQSVSKNDFVSAAPKCDLPPHISILISEPLSIYNSYIYSDHDDACVAGNTDQCVEVIFSVLDIAEDGRLSKAELSRGIRAASLYAAFNINLIEKYRVASRDKVLATFFGMNSLAPFVAQNIIDSYDYDADGFISSNEFLQDRSGLSISNLGAQVVSDLTQGSLLDLLSGFFGTLIRLR